MNRPLVLWLIVYYFSISISDCVVSTDDNDTSSTMIDGKGLIVSTLTKLYQDCQSKRYGFVNCFKAKAIILLDRATRSNVIKLDESISLVRDDNGRSDNRAVYGRILNDNDIDNDYLSDQKNGRGEFGGKLNEMLMEKLAEFLNSRVLKIGFPKLEVSNIVRNLEEGRGKMKKTMGTFMMMIMMKAMMMLPMSIGTLFILAGKALVISKIALILSLLLTLKKILGKPTEHVVHETHGWPSDSAGWDRKFHGGGNNNAHNLAYNSYSH